MLTTRSESDAEIASSPVSLMFSMLHADIENMRETGDEANGDRFLAAHARAGLCAQGAGSGKDIYFSRSVIL
jgi:hypothetical protein